jgi:hypothetical protein
MATNVAPRGIPGQRASFDLKDRCMFYSSGFLARNRGQTFNAFRTVAGVPMS